MSDSSGLAVMPRPTLWGLFSSFAIVSIFGFGGTLAWARRMAVDERKWVSRRQVYAARL
jgi:chromate transporter